MDVAERRSTDNKDASSSSALRRDVGALTERARAKINLTLRIVGRRADGYHLLESLVGFADDLFDDVVFTPAKRLSLTIDGPAARDAGDVDDNLILKAARALESRCDDLVLGAFRLTKRIPVAAGLGGGSADAAAALRLLARASHLSPTDDRLREAACAVGADVLVCLDSRARIMRGIGDVLDQPTTLAPMLVLLVNPRVACPTAEVFRAFSDKGPLAAARRRDEYFASASSIDWISARSNDLEAAAIRVVPAIAEILSVLRATPNCQMARMSGSGATCFALFDDDDSARRAEDALRGAHPDWWIAATAVR